MPKSQPKPAPKLKTAKKVAPKPKPRKLNPTAVKAAQQSNPPPRRTYGT
jgi:hypothetical protein